MGKTHLTHIKRTTYLLLLATATVFTSCDINSIRDAVTIRPISHTLSPNDFQTEPNVFQTEIEDIAKFQIALCDVMIKQYSDLFENNLYVALTADDFGELYSYLWVEYCNKIDKFEKAMEKLWLKEECEEGYKAVLQKVSSTPNHKFQDLAKEVAAEYDRTSVIISDYQQLSTSSDTKVWRFQELNTGIYFRFEYGETWSCYPEEESMTRYLKKHMN